MIVEQSKQIVEEISKAFIGKTEIIEKVLMTIYAGGHVLLEDAPGVGKTTLALAFSKVLGLSNKRIQFTTVLHRRRSQRFWRLWKKIPSVSMVRHMCCHCRLSVSQHRTRWDSPEHSRCRSHS